MDPRDIELTRFYCSENGYKVRVYSDYIYLKKGPVGIILSFGEDCLQNSNKDDTSEIMNKNESVYYKNDNSSEFILYVRIKNSSLLGYIIPYKSIIQFYKGDVPVYSCRDDLMVQYIGYSYKKSSLEHVIMGTPEEVGCAPSCSCCVPPHGPTYHVIVTKKILYEKELGFRNFHYPNGTAIADEPLDGNWTRARDSSYDPYIVEDGVIYKERRREYVYGGNNFFCDNNYSEV